MRKSLHEAPKRKKPAQVVDLAQFGTVLEKYKIVDANNQLTQTGELNIADTHEVLPAGPLVDPEVIGKFMEVAKDAKTMDWMLFQAGGGTAAKEESQRALEEVHQMKIGEMTDAAGWTDSKQRQHRAVSDEEAEAIWERNDLPRFTNELMIADQETLSHYDGRIFGFNRHWPGRDKVYEKVHSAVRDFQKYLTERIGNQSKISLINQAREKRASAANKAYEPIKTVITQYNNLAELERANGEFYYYFKRQEVKKDVRYIGRHPETKAYQHGPNEKIYEDDNVIVVIPATIAASMKAGYENWCVANPTEFERGFNFDPHERQNPRWMQYTQRGPLAFFIFKNLDDPVKKVAAYFSDICSMGDIKPPYGKVQFFDQSNTQTTYEAMKNKLVQRANQPGGMAAGVANSFAEGMKHVAEWANQFDPKQIKSNVYESSHVLACRLVKALLD